MYYINRINFFMEFPFKPISLYGMLPFGDRVALAPPGHCLVCLPLCPHVVAVVQVMVVTVLPCCYVHIQVWPVG